MEKPKEVLVIYRLKFKSKPDFENAIQAFRLGEKMGKYLESLQISFALKRPEPNYLITSPPEINLCEDDLVIYVCSREIRQFVKGSASMDIMTKRSTEIMPRLPYYYELLLRGTFGSVAHLSVATDESI